MKLKPLHSRDDEVVAYSFHCPGCNCLHLFYVGGTVKWNFDGNMEAPTFTPSLLNFWTDAGQPNRCHLILTAGKLAFQADSSHTLAGLTVDLPDHPSPARTCLPAPKKTQRPEGSTP
jgi:Family of unknown function (DUF6527)